MDRTEQEQNPHSKTEESGGLSIPWIKYLAFIGQYSWFGIDTTFFDFPT